MLPAYALYRFDNVLIKIDTRLVSDEKTNFELIDLPGYEYETSYYRNYMRDFEKLISVEETVEL